MVNNIYSPQWETKMRRVLYTYASRFVGDNAEDVVQESFIDFFTKPHTDNPDKGRLHITNICKYKVLSELKRLNKDRMLYDKVVDNIVHPPTPEGHMSKYLLSDNMEEFLDSLSRQEERIVWMSINNKNTEVAKYIGVSHQRV